MNENDGASEPVERASADWNECGVSGGFIPEHLGRSTSPWGTGEQDQGSYDPVGRPPTPGAKRTGLLSGRECVGRRAQPRDACGVSRRSGKERSD